SAGKSSAAADLISAAMFDPRPEIRMATRRFIGSPFETQVTVIDDALVACRNHFTEWRYTLTARRKNLRDLLNCIRPHNRDHADAAVERRQHLPFGNPAPLGKPLENGQYGETRQIDADT